VPDSPKSNFGSKSCILTERGTAALRSLLEKAEWSETANGYNVEKLLEICPGIKDKKTLQKIIRPTEKGNKMTQPVARGSIEDLFQALHCYLDAQSSGGTGRRPLNINDYVESIDLRGCRNDKAIEQFDNLDYVRQLADIDSAFADAEQAVAITMSAPDELTRLWLTYRIHKKIFTKDKPIVYTIKILEYDQPACISHFFEGLAQLLRIEYKDDCRQEILNELCQSNPNRPIMIVASTLGKEHRMAKELIVDEFWVKVQENLTSSPRGRLSRIVLLFVEESEYIEVLRNESLLSLDDLKLSDGHIKQWVVETSGVKIIRESKEGRAWDEEIKMQNLSQPRLTPEEQIIANLHCYLNDRTKRIIDDDNDPKKILRVFYNYLSQGTGSVIDLSKKWSLT
jgi:hypothetical protein